MGSRQPVSWSRASSGDRLPRLSCWLCPCVCLWLLVGCNRQVASPTDPALTAADVPVPYGLAAVVADRRVTLTWSLSASDSAKVSEFLVYRIDSLNARPRRLDSLSWPPFADSTALNGTTYAYAVSARDRNGDRKSTRLNSSHIQKSRMPSSA